MNISAQAADAGGRRDSSSARRIEMYGNSIPARTVVGDLFEYINFQQRYDIDARLQRALK
jgi:hypothetical protein